MADIDRDIERGERILKVLYVLLAVFAALWIFASVMVYATGGKG